MSIVGFDCPICKRQVDLQHYETTKCGLSIPVDYATAVLHSNDDYYGKNLLTVTSGLGCPRSRALEYDTDVYINPLDYNAVITGKGWDAVMERYAPSGSAKVQLKGTIAGMEIHGEIDRAQRFEDMLIISDHKNSNNNAQRFLKKEIAEGKAVKMEYRVQTSLYAELFEQQFHERPTHGMVWNHYAGAESNYNSVFIPLLYETIGLRECLEFKPYNGDYTVEQLYRQASEYRAAQAAVGGTVDLAAVFALPLVGTTMSFGSAEFCNYCQVRTACTVAAQGAPF